MTQQIYLDYNASTPIAPEVRDAMRPYLEMAYGNPSSGHWAGRPAREAVEAAREQVARFLSAEPDEIIFTSGGTESNNSAVLGTWYAQPEQRGRIVTSAVEHPATAEPCRFLERMGAELTVLPVDRFGQVDPGGLGESIDKDVVLVTVMHANNEVGTIQPIRRLAEIAHRHRAVFHTDAAQSAGKIPVDVAELDVDLLSLAGHKVYGPKGIGALYVRRGTPFEPLVRGAGHERGLRSGTESALLAVGLGMACQVAGRVMAENIRLRQLRDRLWNRLHEALGEDVVLQGHPEERLPNTLNVAFRGRAGAEILARCPGLAASTGAACHSGSARLSDTLQAMGIPPEDGVGSVRLSLGRMTTPADIEASAQMLISACGASVRKD